jgi:predicted DNA binding CopG/RHH family protein
MPKSLPRLKNDKAAETFVATADLTQYDLSGGRIVRYELKPKDRAVSLRLSEQLFKATQARAKREGVPVQRFIRLALERALETAK